MVRCRPWPLIFTSGPLLLFSFGFSGNFIWAPILAFPAILQLLFDLGHGISLLDFPPWSMLAFFHAYFSWVSFPSLQENRMTCSLHFCLSCLLPLKKTTDVSHSGTLGPEEALHFVEMRLERLLFPYSRLPSQLPVWSSTPVRSAVACQAVGPVTPCSVHAF